MSYPYDPDVRARVAALLYDHLPELLRVRDEEEQLLAFVRVLGAPLALVRQRVADLHADLFIDTCGDDALAALAERIGTRLVFPDAVSNRLDLRGAVGWRRRKGTPEMLQDLSATLTQRSARLVEGWQRLAVVQDLNLLRPDRPLPDVRRPTLAALAQGPTDGLHHLVDLRRPGEGVARHQPDSLSVWLHPTLLAPLRQATASAFVCNTGVTPTESRYTLDVRGGGRPVRVETGDTDRVHSSLYAADPWRWFGVDLGVYVCGLLAAAPASAPPRAPGTLPADPLLVSGLATAAVLVRETRRQSCPVTVELCAVPLAAGLPQTAQARVRAGLLLNPEGDASPVTRNGVGLSGAVAMLRLRPQASSGYFPGATLAFERERIDAARASADPTLAVQGFLRGAVAVTLPAGWLHGERWLYVGADGSLAPAQSTPGGPVDVPLAGGALPAGAWAGPGPEWPPRAHSASAEPLRRVPAALERGPARLQGGQAIRVSTASASPSPVSLIFAMGWTDGGLRHVRPFQRLSWSASSAPTWAALDDQGADTAAEPRYAALAQLREDLAGAATLLVRLECEAGRLALPPGLVAWVAPDGQVVPIHLPELVADAPQDPRWPTPRAYVSAAVEVHTDGSTWRYGANTVARESAGPYAPLPGPRLPTCRVLAERALCGWERETPTLRLAPATRGTLELDPRHGLFALADPPQPWTPLAGATAPPSVSVSLLEGATLHLGALPLARGPELGEVLPAPTRRVSRLGQLPPDEDASDAAVPRYRSLEAAFQAIRLAPRPVEVVQFEDSATYDENLLIWPTGPQTLILQAAERQRPFLRLRGASGSASYGRLSLTGLLISGTLTLPDAGQIDLRYLSQADASVLSWTGRAGATLRMLRCNMATLRAGGLVEVEISNSLLDPGGPGATGRAIWAPDATLTLDQVSALGQVRSRTLEASACLFLGAVEVTDRFAGCVRYCRLPEGAVVPRRHRCSVDAPVFFVSRDRGHPAHARLAPRTDRAVLRGAEDGAEVGAHHDTYAALRTDGLLRRLDESTPAGLITGILSRD